MWRQRWECDSKSCICSECGGRSWAVCYSVGYLQRLHCWPGTGWWAPMMMLAGHLTVHNLMVTLMETMPGGWWTWAKQYVIDGVTIHSSDGTTSMLLRWIMKGRLVLNLYYGTLLKISFIHVCCLKVYGWHKLLHFQDEYALGYISIRVSDSADISSHTESQECVKWDEERFPKSTSQTLSCTSHLEGRYVSIQRTDGQNTRDMILCEVLVTGIIDGTSPCMHMFPVTGDRRNLVDQAKEELEKMRE